MVRAQGGDVSYIDDPSLFKKGVEHKVFAPHDGYLTKIDTERYGTSALLLGAGRQTKEDILDMGAGITLHKKTGDSVKKGDTLATLYASDAAKLSVACERFLSAVTYADAPPKMQPLVHKIIL